MQSEAPVADLVVVGAGMAGLTAARLAARAGRRVLVLEAGDAAGGRLATRAIGAGRGDSGAQFFTVRTAEFQTVCDDWLAEGLIFEWTRGWGGGDFSDGYPRYAASGGFSALANSLTRGLDVRYATRLAAVSHDAAGWRLTAVDGAVFRGRTAILTPPLPLSLALLDAGRVAQSIELDSAVRAIHYAPCLSGLFLLDGETLLPESGALQRPDAAISWLADNYSKGISPGGRVLTVHAGISASRERWRDDDEAVLAWMGDEIKPWLAADCRILQARLDRWPHAVPETTYPARTAVCRAPGWLAFAGDAFDGPRVEGAALSGAAAAGALLK